MLAQMCLICYVSNSTSRHQAYLGGLSTPLKTIQRAKARPVQVGACTENSDLSAASQVHHLVYLGRPHASL